MLTRHQRYAASSVRWDEKIGEDGGLLITGLWAPTKGMGRVELRRWISELPEDQTISVNLLLPIHSSPIFIDFMRAGFFAATDQLLERRALTQDPSLDWIDRMAPILSLPAPGVVQVIYRDGFATARFPDGLAVDLIGCPKTILLRDHWNADGECQCPSTEK